ncbi:MAG TPA: SCO family protein [Vicinamibacterales bacterium]|jgi:protein SCO1/2
MSVNRQTVAPRTLARLAVAIAIVLVACAARQATAAIPDDRPVGLAAVGIDQRLGDSLPLDLRFHDEHGNTVRLADYFGRLPVILTLNYFDCPMLCPLELNDVLRAARAMPLNLGSDYQILTVSIDPDDTPARAIEKQHWFAERYGRPGGATGWHFLTGDADAIRSLTQAVGFRYSRDQASGQYAHVAGLMVVTPDGRLTRYFFGLEYSPRDVRLALVDASNGRIGSIADQVLLFCFHYDESAGRYNFAIVRAVRAGGILTVFGLGALMTVMFRRERRATRNTR